MCVTDRHDMTLAVKVASTPIQSTNFSSMIMKSGQDFCLDGISEYENG